MARVPPWSIVGRLRCMRTAVVNRHSPVATRESATKTQVGHSSPSPRQVPGRLGELVSGPLLGASSSSGATARVTAAAGELIDRNERAAGVEIVIALPQPGHGRRPG